MNGREKFGGLLEFPTGAALMAGAGREPGAAPAELPIGCGTDPSPPLTGGAGAGRDGTM
jgi:hypothetical protein